MAPQLTTEWCEAKAKKAAEAAKLKATVLVDIWTSRILVAHWGQEWFRFHHHPGKLLKDFLIVRSEFQKSTHQLREVDEIPLFTRILAPFQVGWPWDS